jgi:hypothetical protein
MLRTLLFSFKAAEREDFGEYRARQDVSTYIDTDQDCWLISVQLKGVPNSM